MAIENNRVVSRQIVVVKGNPSGGIKGKWSPEVEEKIHIQNTGKSDSGSRDSMCKSPEVERVW